MMRVLGQQGDIRVEWDPADEDSVTKAREEWTRLQADGYEFFSESATGKPRRVKVFRKGLGRVLAAPGVRTKADRKSGARQAAMAGGPNARSARIR